MTASIIEDEIPAGKRLEKLLLENGFIVLKQLHSVKATLLWFKENNMPDYIFMDIELADGKCFELFEKIKIESKVIFTTAYDEYALQAFEYNAIDYLLKPIDKEKLKKMLSKVRAFKDSFLSEIEILRDNLTHNYRKSFIVTSVKELKKISTEEIVGFTSQNNVTFFFSFNNRQYSLDTSLEQLETVLDCKQFFRINRKFIINKNFIIEIKNNDEVVTNYISSDSLKVSRLKRKKFFNWFES